MAKKGIKFSEEHKRKISIARKGQPSSMLGKHHSEETKRKIGLKSKLRKHTEETKNKIREKLKGKKLSTSTIEKMKLNRKGMLGKHHTMENRKKISEAVRKNPARYWLGKHMSESTKEKLRKYVKEKASSWKGGISFEPYSVDWTETLKRSIRERDKYTCQICGKLQTNESFSIHHIDYNKKNCDPKNLITLCRSCHGKTNHHREYWINYFNK